MTNRKTSVTNKYSLEELIIKAIEHTGDAIGLSDAEGRRIFQNKKFCEFFGFNTPDELQAAGGLSALIQNKTTDAEISAVVKKNGIWTGELNLVTKSNQILPAFGRINAIRNDQGTVIGFSDVFTILSRCKHSEKLLQIQHDLTETLCSADNLEEALEFSLDFAIKAAEMDCGAIYLFNGDGSLAMHSHSGLSESFLRVTEFYPSDSLYTNLVLKGEAIFTQYKNLGIPVDEIRKKEGLQTIAIIPVKHKHRVIGCINIGAHRPTDFPKISQNALETLTSIMGQYIIRLKAKEELKLQCIRYSNLIKNLRGIVYHCNNDKNWSIKFISRGCFTLTGYKQEDFLENKSLSFNDIILPRYRNYLSKKWQRSLKNHEHFEAEYKIRTASGEIKWVWERGCGIFKGDGRLSHMEGNIIDITKRKQAELTLKESRHHYRNLFEKAQIGLFRTQVTDGLFLEANQQMIQMLGYDSGDDIIGKISVEDHYADKDIRSDLILQVQKTGKLKNYETRFKRKDNSIFWVHISAVSYEKEGYFEGVCTDITKSKKTEIENTRLEARNRQTQKVEAIGRLAAGVAHDLNNLLTPILGYGEILTNNFSPDDTRKRHVNHIVKAGYRIRALVRQLLAFGRKQTLEYRPLSLNTVIQDFEKLLRRTIREDIEFEIILDPDIKTVNADIGQIEQVIMNLSVNAQDAMQKGGILTFETSMTKISEADAEILPGTRPGRFVRLAVSDTGCGMDQETREHIFDPFFSTKGEQGNGLGLATVYGIIKQHRGNIWVYSEPGEGTTFKVYLPASEKKELEEKIQDKAPKNLKGAETILLVEDNEPVLDISLAILQENNYRVLVAKSGDEALKVLDSHDDKVDLLLTDVIMPGMNGKELYIKATEKQPGIKVLYMSGYTDNVIGQHGVLDEGVQFIQKPFTVSGLATKIRDVLESE